MVSSRIRHMFEYIIKSTMQCSGYRYSGETMKPKICLENSQQRFLWFLRFWQRMKIWATELSCRLWALGVSVTMRRSRLTIGLASRAAFQLRIKYNLARRNWIWWAWTIFCFIPRYPITNFDPITHLSLSPWFIAILWYTLDLPRYPICYAQVESSGSELDLSSCDLCPLIPCCVCPADQIKMIDIF